jgi:glycerophosphoryl diester phosphodiesterase
MIAPLLLPVTGPALVSAHRGGMDRAPENTMVAFEQAVDDGAEMIELDVHPTRDGELVVIHDVTTTRTTGHDDRVHNLTASQVMALDAGAAFTSYDATEPEPVPTLEQVLRWAKSHAYLNVDVRNYPALSAYRMRETVDRLVAHVRDADMADQVILQCLDHHLARQIRQSDPSIRVGITQHGRPVDPVALAESAGACLISTDAEFATLEMVAELHEAGVGVMSAVDMRLPGLSNDERTVRETVARLLAHDVDILVTDHVPETRAMMRAVLDGAVRPHLHERPAAGPCHVPWNAQVG